MFFPPFLVMVPCRSQQVTDDEGHDLARGFGCQLVETSARTRSNVAKLFETVMLEVEKGSGILADDPAPVTKPPGMCTVL
jgi:GTPase SAR1 family protein